jgi:hypothetical protein
MATEGNFTKETTIYVSTASKLTAGETQNVIDELLHIIGYPSDYAGFKFQFIDGGDLVQANARVDSQFRVSIGD